LGVDWGKKGMHLRVLERVIWRVDLGLVVGGAGGLTIEFKGVKMFISKLTYKCMKHENMKLIDIKT
jgi:hypothetical protein